MGKSVILEGMDFELELDKFNNSSYRERLLAYLPDKYAWFEEVYSARKIKNWVLYNKDDYDVVRNHLKAKLDRITEDLSLPINCKSTRCMFYDLKVPDGSTLGDKFDTSDVEDMYGMFEYTYLPKGFKLGNNFNTSKVTRMVSMFHCTVCSEDFSLGNKFDTSNVRNMESMFLDATVPSNFYLGDKFSTKNCMGLVDIFDMDTACNLVVPSCFELSKLPDSLSGVLTVRFGSDDNFVNKPKEKLSERFMRYVSVYKSIYRSVEVLVKEGEYPIREIYSCASSCRKSLIPNCRVSCEKLLNTKDNSKSVNGVSQSNLTVGQTIEALKKQGYPEEVISEVMLRYLSMLCISE